MVPIDHFDVAAERHPHETAVIDGDVALTYGELLDMSRRVGGFVSAVARGAGDAVPAVVYAPNDYRFIIAMLGIMRAGAAIVPLHASNDLETSVGFLSQVEPRCMFYHSSVAARVAELRRHVPSLVRFVCLDRAGDGDPSLADVIAAPAEPLIEWMDASGNRDRPSSYWATSGTTGRPKVVVGDCGTYDAALRLNQQRRARHVPVGTTVSMSLAPMTHGGGPSAFTTLTRGGTVLVMRQFDPLDVLEKIQRHRVTDLWLSPTALTLLLDYPGRTGFDLSSLRTVLLAAASIAPETLRRAVAWLGPCVVHSYGQIEAGFITYFDSETLAAAVQGEHPERLASSGRVAPGARVAVADERGVLQPAGHEGEIVVRGTCVKRYLDTDATAAARRDGWHRTGDIGYMDGDGFLYVTGRVKDVVNVAGFKVACAQVERVIEEVDGVQQCAVVPAPDPVRGEVIRAVVTTRPGHSMDAARIIAHCRAKLGSGKTPRIVEHWQELPRSPAGKIDKHRIRTTPV